MRGCDVGRFRREIDLPAKFCSVLIVCTMYVASAASEQNSEHRSKVCENTGRPIHPVFCVAMLVHLHSKARRQGSFPHGVVSGFKPEPAYPAEFCVWRLTRLPVKKAHILRISIVGQELTSSYFPRARYSLTVCVPSCLPVTLAEHDCDVAGATMQDLGAGVLIPRAFGP